MIDQYPRKALDDVKHTTFSSFLDFARWSSAALVFVSHLRDPLFLGYHEIPRHSATLAVKVWYFVTGWYYDAVLIFFVLSGFLVGGLSLARATEGRFSPTDYAIDRFTRLFLPYLPALVLTYMLDRAGAAWFAASGLYNHTQAMIVQKIAMGSFIQYDTPKTFLLNLVMLQNFRADTLGSNGPLWSLSAEFWFYVVFGIVMVAYRGSATGKTAGILLLALIAILLGPAFPPLLALWCIGVACAFVPSGRRIEQPIPASLLFVGLLAASRLNSPLLDHRLGLKYVLDFSAACSFGWLLVSMRNVRFSIFVKTSAINKILSGFSYSLYLMHFPLMLFLLGVCYFLGFHKVAQGYSPTDPTGLFLYAAIILLVYALTYAFSLVTENQTRRCRHLLKNFIEIVQIAPKDAPEPCAGNPK